MGAVIATDLVSADADRDNGVAFAVRAGAEGVMNVRLAYSAGLKTHDRVR